MKDLASPSPDALRFKATGTSSSELIDSAVLYSNANPQIAFDGTDPWVLPRSQAFVPGGVRLYQRTTSWNGVTSITNAYAGDLQYDPSGPGPISFVYTATSNGALWFGTWSGSLGGQPLAPSAFDDELSLAFGPNGRAGVAFLNGNARLSYVQRTNGTWGSPVVVDATRPARWPSLVFGPTGIPYIAYTDGGNRDLRWASRASGSWKTSLLDGASTKTGWRPSLALDPGSNPRIAYEAESPSHNLRWAAKNGTTWKFSTILTNSSNALPVTGGGPSLVYLSSGAPRIAYGGSDNKLRWAKQ